MAGNPEREAGEVVMAKPGYMFIAGDLGGADLFAHKGNSHGLLFATGTRVTYVRGDSGKGPCAFDVRPEEV